MLCQYSILVGLLTQKKIWVMRAGLLSSECYWWLWCDPALGTEVEVIPGHIFPWSDENLSGRHPKLEGTGSSDSQRHKARRRLLTHNFIFYFHTIYFILNIFLLKCQWFFFFFCHFHAKKIIHPSIPLQCGPCSFHDPELKFRLLEPPTAVMGVKVGWHPGQAASWPIKLFK